MADFFQIIGGFTVVGVIILITMYIVCSIIDLYKDVANIKKRVEKLENENPI